MALYTGIKKFLTLTKKKKNYHSEKKNTNFHSRTFETSAATGHNVQELFDYIATKVNDLPITPISSPSKPLNITGKSVFVTEVSSVEAEQLCSGCKKKQKKKNPLIPEISASSRFDPSAFEIDVFSIYKSPYHLAELDHKKISGIACDASVVAISETGNVHVWGGPGINAKDILLSNNFNLMHLGERGIKSLRSSGSELVALDNEGKAYVITLYGASPMICAPNKLLSLSVLNFHSIFTEISLVCISALYLGQRTICCNHLDPWSRVHMGLRSIRSTRS